MEISKKKMYFRNIRQNKDSGINYFEKSNFPKLLFNIYTDTEKKSRQNCERCVCISIYLYLYDNY